MIDIQQHRLLSARLHGWFASTQTCTQCRGAEHVKTEQQDSVPSQTNGPEHCLRQLPIQILRISRFIVSYVESLIIGSLFMLLLLYTYCIILHLQEW